VPNVYATRQDFNRYGLRGGQLANQGRLAESAVGTDAFTLEGHGFETGWTVLLRAASGGTLAAPLVAGLPYYVIRDSESTFRVSATVSGAAIDLTSIGMDVVVTTPLPIDELLEVYSRYVDGFLPAEFVPLGAPYPLEVTVVVCELTGAKLYRLTGQESASMKDEELSAKAKLERWAKGLGVVGVATSANLSYGESLAVDLRGWGGGDILR